MKTCPNCGEQVPVDAPRCKSCFHDFAEAPRKGVPILQILGVLLIMMLAGAGAFGYIYYFNVAKGVVVDEETHSIVFTRKSASGTETERVQFSDVQRIEHVMGGEDAMFEVVAVTNDGKRYILNSSGEGTLMGYAEHVAAVMDKPLEEIRNVRGFGE